MFCNISPLVPCNDSPENHSIQCLWQKILCNTGMCISSFPLSSVGDAYLRKLPRWSARLHSPRQPNRNVFVEARWVSPLLAPKSYLSIFSSRYLPLVPVSSPVQAKLGFSLGPQSHVCSQLSTSNTGDTEGKASRREQRNIMGKTNRLHLLWVMWSGFHFLVYMKPGGKKCQWDTGPKDKCSHFRI